MIQDTISINRVFFMNNSNILFAIKLIKIKFILFKHFDELIIILNTIKLNNYDYDNKFIFFNYLLNR